MLFCRCLIIFVSFAAAQSGINVFGLSYHPDRQTEDGFNFREFNPGIGLRHWVQVSEWRQTTLDAGLYLDSGGYLLIYGAAVFQFRVWKPLYVSTAIGLLKTDNLNNGKPFIAAIPGLMLNFESFQLNMMYIPAVEMNPYTAFGFYGTIKLN